MSDAPPVIRLRGAGRRFGSHEALRDLDLTVHAGERVAVLGTSGAGKSTLLALLNGSLDPTTGSVEVFGENLARLASPRRRLLQRRIGSVSQDLALIEQVRVLHNVNAGRLGRWSTTRALVSLVWPRSLGVVRDARPRALHARGRPAPGPDRPRPSRRRRTRCGAERPLRARMTLRLDAPPSPTASMPGREPVSGRRTLLRKLTALAGVTGLLAWAVHRAVPSGGELVNRGGSALLDDLAATALHPSLEAEFLGVVLEAMATTLSLALLGTAGALVMGLAGGLILSDVAWGGSLPWPVRVGRLFLRGTLVAVRSVHELVWALFFVSVLGLDPLVAVLALALPFGAQSAQVFGETFDTVPDAPLRSLLAAGARRCSALAYALLPGTAPLLLSYSFYRFECALRSAVVLGVAGVGGLEFELTVSLQSRNWGEVWTLVAALLALAGAVELWSNHVRSDVAVVTCADWSVGRERSRDEGRSPRGLSRSTRWSLTLVVPAIAVAWWWVGLSPAGLASARTRDLADRLLRDLWPPALPEGGLRVLTGAALDTVAMAVLAMVAAVMITLLVAPWAGRPRADRRGPAAWGRWTVWWTARLLLLVLRSIPPTVWAVVALLGLFPGVLPGPAGRNPQQDRHSAGRGRPHPGKHRRAPVHHHVAVHGARGGQRAGGVGVVVGLLQVAEVLPQRHPRPQPHQPDIGTAGIGGTHMERGETGSHGRGRGEPVRADGDVGAVHPGGRGGRARYGGGGSVGCGDVRCHLSSPSDVLPARHVWPQMYADPEVDVPAAELPDSRAGPGPLPMAARSSVR